MKLSEFVEQVMDVTEKPSKIVHLEEFLRSLWQVINVYKDQKLSAALFVQLLSEAWAGDPGDFDPEWLKIEESADDIEFDTNKQMDDFDYLKGTILYQIADLRRMRDAGYFEMDGNILFMGVQSPTGSSWYNWSPVSFLECGTRGMQGAARQDIELNDFTWRNLAELLYLGQMYE